MLVSEDAGSSWTDPNGQLVDRLFTAIVFHPIQAANVYGLRKSGLLARSSDGGRTWAEVGVAPAGASTLSVDPADAERLYVSVAAGVSISDDGGRSWHDSSEGLPTKEGTAAAGLSALVPASTCCGYLHCDFLPVRPINSSAIKNLNFSDTARRDEFFDHMTTCVAHEPPHDQC